jgi:hypothetical protein
MMPSLINFCGGNMWVCLNSAFLSIVEPTGQDLNTGDMLLVRARRKGDIESVFPNAAVEKRPERDYLFRALIPRQEVAAAMADQVRAIGYPNFKDSVKNNRLHDAYAAVWGIMAKLQPTRPYSGRGGGRQGALL